MSGDYTGKAPHPVFSSASRLTRSSGCIRHPDQVAYHRRV